MLALIQVNPPAVLEVVDAPTVRVNIPGLWQADDVSAGYITPDGAYKVVAVTRFVTPTGTQIVGEPSYSIDQSGSVTETYSTQLVPVQQPSVSSINFYNLFTTAEQIAITVLARTDAQTDLFMKRAAAAGAVQLGNAEVINGLAYLVSKGVITQDRATQVAAGTPPT